MEELKIQIPDDKEIDWEASAEQKKVVLKDKQLTYNDVCKELFSEQHYYISEMGEVIPCFMEANDANASPTEHQLKCILAKNQLANVAKYLNGNWDNFPNNNHYIIWMHPRIKSLHIEQATLSSEYNNIIFKSKEAAQQAIVILGRDTIRLALEPLY